MRTRSKFVVAILATMLAGSSHAWAKRILPDSCGADKVEYDAKTQKNPPALAGPAEGKAQIVLIQTKAQKGHVGGFGIYDFTTRFGMDGAWLGAAANNSYFAIDITPGEHHLCANVQNTMSGAKDMIGMKKFTAEAGKTYYFKFDITKMSTDNGAHSFTSTDNIYSFTFEPVDEDEGKFGVKALPLSEFKVHVDPPSDDVTF